MALRSLPVRSMRMTAASFRVPQMQKSFSTHTCLQFNKSMKSLVFAQRPAIGLNSMNNFFSQQRYFATKAATEKKDEKAATTTTTDEKPKISKSVERAMRRADNNKAKVIQLLEKTKVIPDVISSYEPIFFPKQAYPGLRIVFLNIKGKPLEINASLDDVTQLEFADTEVEPKPVWEPEYNTFYTLVSVDPDGVLANGQRGPVRQWGIVNIPGSSYKQGQVVSPYVGAKPTKGSGKHRYVFVLYKQKDGKITVPVLDTDANLESPSRQNFNVREFAAKYNLGAPVGARLYESINA